MPDPNVIVLLGPPSAGKGVQAQYLASHWPARHLSSGALLREAARTDPQLEQALRAGQLVPSQAFFHVVGRAVADTPVGVPIIADGMTRRPEEVGPFIELLAGHGRAIRRVVVLDLPRDETDRRAAARGRDDDGRHADRWQEYLKVTAASISRYEELGLLSRVDGRGDVETVAERVRAAAGL